jgi:PIN domain nuclease of toxin-antitoxin system
MIVLDTHVWIWWLSNPKTLSQRAQTAVTKAIEDGAIFISSISSWEVALLVARDRLRLTMEVSDWIGKSEVLPFVTFVPVDNAIALRAVSLPGSFHNDPADRIIVATSLTLGAPVITRDERILNYRHVKAIW